MKSALPVFTMAFLAFSQTSRPADATTASISFGVSATVQASCVASAAVTGFRTYTAAMENAADAVSVTCDNTTPHVVRIEKGRATGAMGTARILIGPGSDSESCALISTFKGDFKRDEAVGPETVARADCGSSKRLTILNPAAETHFNLTNSHIDWITVTVIY
jgi:spore coat protein U-like protein